MATNYEFITNIRILARDIYIRRKFVPFVGGDDLLINNSQDNNNMTKAIKLEAQSRTKEDGKPQKIRSRDFIPAVLYGPNIESRNLKIKQIDFKKIFAVAGESNLVDLAVDDKPAVKILIKEVQKNPLKDNIIHADLYEVDMEKKITTEIPLFFVGESPAVKELAAILVKNMDSVEVECLPGDLVSHIDVDLSVLKNYHDSIKMNDLQIPSGIKFVNETNDIAASVMEYHVEVEEPQAPVEGEVVAGDAAAATATTTEEEGKIVKGAKETAEPIKEKKK